MLETIVNGGEKMGTHERKRIATQSSDVCKLKRYVDQLVPLFMNEEYGNADRRAVSIIRQPFVDDMDPFVGQPYPLGCMGSYARLTAENLEAFINVGNIISKLRLIPQTGDLRSLIKAAEANDVAYQALRIAIRDAIKIIGARAYKHEWIDNLTYMNIDTLLEGLAAYRKCNQVIAEQLTDKLNKELAGDNEMVVLDLGSGVGGTSMELLRQVDKLTHEVGGIRNSRKKIKLVLYDVSPGQLEIAKKTLQNEFGINDIVLVEGGFDELGARLSGYVHSIDIIVSGAAICHVINKEQFFNELNRMMTPGGVLSFWDPAFPIYRAHYVRLTNNDDHYVEYRTDKGEVYRVGKSDVVNIEVLRKLENRQYTTYATVDEEGLTLFATALIHMYLGQMGFSADNVEARTMQNLKNKLAGDVMNDATKEPGFNLIEWYRRNLAANSDLSMPIASWTPYDLIEAVSEEDEFKRVLSKSGFKSYRARRIVKPQLSFDNNSVQSIFAFFYAERRD